MNKSQLIEAVADETGFSKTCARKVVESVLRVSVQTLRQGERVTLTGFGTFTTNQLPERSGRNPRTGALVRIPSKRVVRFRSSFDPE